MILFIIYDIKYDFLYDHMLRLFPGKQVFLMQIYVRAYS